MLFRSELTRTTPGRPEVIRSVDAGTGGPFARLLFSMHERRRFEISEGVLPPHTAGVPSDHGRGSIEHGYVIEGRVCLTIGGERIILDQGDAVRFASGTSHAYSTDDIGARLLTVVVAADE